MNELYECTISKSVNNDDEQNNSKAKDETTCLATECVQLKWIIPSRVRKLMFVFKDVLMIHVEKTIILHNLKTKKDDILVIGANKSTSAGRDTIPLDSLGCVDCCSTTGLLALAERSPKSKILIYQYPELKVLTVFEDARNTASYKCIAFMKCEYLVGLRDAPAFDLVVWAWRIQEILLSVDTGFKQPNQFISVSDTVDDGVAYLGHTERAVRCRLQLWSLHLSCKRAYAEKTAVHLPDDADVDDRGCWTPSGWYVFRDTPTGVRRARPDRPDTEETSVGKVGARGPVVASKSGFLFYASGQLRCFNDIDGVFTEIWNVRVDHKLHCMVTDEDLIYGLSNQGVLLEMTQTKSTVLKVYGMNVKYFAYVEPANQTVAVISNDDVLQVWDTSTGRLISGKNLDGKATHLCSNPVYSYLAVSFENGKVELLWCDTETNELKIISKVVLCDEEISSVNFFSNGEQCVATSIPTGTFFCIHVRLGRQCSVENEFHFDKQVVHIATIEHKKRSLLAVLYKNPETPDGAKNNIILFNKRFDVVFEWKETRYCYKSIMKWIPSDDPVVIKIALTVTSSRRYHLMTINIKTKVSGLEAILSDHSRGNVKIYTRENLCVSFSDDGSYNLYEFDGYGGRTKIVTVNCSHWQTGGIIAAQIDYNARNILILSRAGNFACTTFKETCDHMRHDRRVKTPTFVDDMETEGIGCEIGVTTQKRITWNMIREQNELNANTIAYNKQRQQITYKFKEIKFELLALLDDNLNGPEDKVLDIEEFDLNVDNRIEYKEKCKIKLMEFEAKVRRDIERFKMETLNIINEHWKDVEEKPKSIYSFEAKYIVDNYPITLKDKVHVEIARRVFDKRMAIKSYAEPLDMFDFETVQQNECNISNYKLLMGSISQQLINDIIELRLISQPDYTLESVQDEQILLYYVIIELKFSFNRLFDNIFVEKRRLLDKLNGYNDQLRVIEDALKLTCKIEPVDPTPTNYDWNQYEQTDKLLTVDDSELRIKPYASVLPRQISVIKNPNMEKHEKQLLAIRQFKQEALIKMMDGVLEKRMEDELMTDVPIPLCMTQKAPEDYTEEDVKAISEYETSVKIKNNDRMKYKQELEKEKKKITKLIKNDVETFDTYVYDLFKTKFLYESAINQEYLKIIRLTKMLNTDKKEKSQIQLLENKIQEAENIIDEITGKIANTEADCYFLQNSMEVLKAKYNSLNESFEAEFHSKTKYDKALTAYNRIPKVPNVSQYSTLLSYQLANTIMDPTDKKLNLLNTELVQYIETIGAYEDYKYVIHKRLQMDKKTWDKICNYRRSKIKLEFEINAYEKDILDKINLKNNLQQRIKSKEAIIERTKLSRTRLEKQNLHYTYDPEIQFVLKRKNIEINLTGKMSDFKNAELLPDNEFSEKAFILQETLNNRSYRFSVLIEYQKKSRHLKSEYTILRDYKIALYQYRYNYILSLEMNKNIIHYFKFKMKGINIAQRAQQAIDNELSVLETNYLKEKKEIQECLNKLTEKIGRYRRKNKDIDKNISQMNLQVYQLKAKIDHSIDNKLALINHTRMENIMKYSKMMKKLKILHKEVMVLEKEWETWLNKINPGLHIFSKNKYI